MKRRSFIKRAFASALLAPQISKGDLAPLDEGVTELEEAKDANAENTEDQGPNMLIVNQVARDMYLASAGVQAQQASELYKAMRGDSLLSTLKGLK